MSLRLLTFKVVMLLLLVISQRGQTILGLGLKGVDMTENLVFKMSKLLKRNRLGDALDTIVLKLFDQCKRLCVVRTVKEYVKRTARNEKGGRQTHSEFLSAT